ncbi:hypothetical protein IQ07DRAFT_601750 [Pyrenochaeta sp. DS3sAY3a]|nr:hypothetical protein IQ07DRAFT_601750 [Pyrenochaeta sp. DS3sAY3a]
MAGLPFTLSDFMRRGARPGNSKRAKSPDPLEPRKKRPKTSGPFFQSEDEDEDAIEDTSESIVSSQPAQKPRDQEITSKTLQNPIISTSLQKKQIKKLSLSAFLEKKNVKQAPNALQQSVKPGGGPTARKAPTLEPLTGSTSMPSVLSGNPFEKLDKLPGSSSHLIFGQNQSGYTEYAGIQSKPFPSGSPFQQKTVASDSGPVNSVITPSFQSPNDHFLRPAEGLTKLSKNSRKIPGQSSSMEKRKRQPAIPAKLTSVGKGSRLNPADKSTATHRPLIGGAPQKHDNIHMRKEVARSSRGSSSVPLTSIEDHHDFKYSLIWAPLQAKGTSVEKSRTSPNTPSSFQSILNQASQATFSSPLPLARKQPAEVGPLSKRNSKEPRTPKSVRFAPMAGEDPTQLDADIIDAKIDPATLDPPVQLTRSQHIQDQQVHTQQLQAEQTQAWSTKKQDGHTLVLPTQELQSQQLQTNLPQPDAPIPRDAQTPTNDALSKEPINLATILTPLSPEAEPYFEYTIYQKLWPSTSPEATAPNYLLTWRPYTSIDAANAEAQRLFTQTRTQYEQTFGSRFSSSTTTLTAHNCVEHTGTFSPPDYSPRKTHLRIWVRRDYVSRLANTTPEQLHPTPFVASTVYILRVLKHTDTPTADPDIKIEDANFTAPQRIFCAPPCTEVYTTAHAANHAACRLQIDMSHQERPGEVAKGWQEKDCKRLWEVLRGLEEGDAEGDAEGLWRSEFMGRLGSGMAGRYEVFVERGDLEGPRNL